MKIGRRVLLAGGFALLAAGCGKEEPEAPVSPGVSGAAAGGGTDALTQAELDGIGPATRPHRIALVVKTRNNPFFDPMIRAAEGQAHTLGVELEVQAPAQETDKERQFALVQDLVARGVDAILIAPADSRGIVPALKQAQEKGVLVINLDNRVDPEAARQSGVRLAAYIGADNEAGGRLAGEAMVEALGEGAQVAILEGIRGADNAEARKRGFTSAVEGRLEIVASDTAEWDTQKAYIKFQSMLTAQPGLKGLFCANDKMAVGALKAIAEAGRQGQLTVIGYDNIPDVQPYLQSGELYATIEQHPDLMGKYGLQAAVGLLEKRLEPEKEFLVPLEVIRKS